MAVTVNAARDAILKLFNDAWAADTPAIVGSVPAVDWGNVDADETPAQPDEYWARVRVQHGPADQRTFGEAGNRRFERTGQVVVQIFAPLGSGQQKLDELVQLATDALEGRTADIDGSERVQFRGASPNEVGRSGPWYQANVTVQWEYDQLK